MRPERDNQQLIKQNPMCILIFYIYSRLSDLLAGRLQRLFIWSRSHPLSVAVAGVL